MFNSDKDFQAAHELGKIYNALMDKALLCDFFLESTMKLTEAAQGFLFLSENNDALWLESSIPQSGEAPQAIQGAAQDTLLEGKPLFLEKSLFVPLIVRNSAIGVACFMKNDRSAFSQKAQSLASDLSSQAASALKNIILFEQNLQMEKLAAIGQTMSIVMHEIKNIVQLATFAEEYLRMGLSRNHEEYLNRGLDGIRKAIRQMDGFTYEILSLTKNYQIKPEKIEMPPLLEELKNDFSKKAAQYKIELDFQVEEAFPAVTGEVRSLYRTLVNLVKNALEACGKKGSCVRVRVRSRDENFYEIVIEDDGEGMTPKVKAKIFQAFFSTKGESGTGLGLLVIDRTVKAHGGRVQVESEAGKGTSFRLVLPKKL